MYMGPVMIVLDSTNCPKTCTRPEDMGNSNMLLARNLVDGTFISAYEFKAMRSTDRPDTLVCPGISAEGAACTASVSPAALTSDHMHPYFRVARVSDHVVGCTEASTRVESPDKATDLVGTKGKQGPRGPRQLIRITLRHPQAAATLAAQKATRATSARIGHHRAPAPTSGTRTLTVQCGIRKAALDHARGIITDTHTVSLGDNKGAASRFIYPTDRLINAPYNGHEVIAYGQLHSVSKGNAANTYFIRLCLPDGRPTKVSIMISAAHYAALRVRLTQVMLEPTAWMLIACGTVTGREEAKRYLRPVGARSVHFQRTSLKVAHTPSASLPVSEDVKFSVPGSTFEARSESSSKSTSN